MKTLTIQARLTAWYLLILSVVLGLLAGGSWFAMKSSIHRMIDRNLGYQIQAVVPFIQSHSLRTREQFDRLFASASDSAVVGVFVQITDDRGKILYESAVLRSHQVPVLADGPADGTVLLSSLVERGWPVRFAAQRVSVAGLRVTVRVVEPMRDLIAPLRAYQLYLAMLIVIFLPLTSSIGYWLSRGALAPAEQIRLKAEAIDWADLTMRLQVPAADDEVARLVRTLNAMLARIETGFRSIERFTVDAHDELYDPISLIKAAGEMSLRGELTAEELRDVLRMIVCEARHLSNLVENLLKAARSDARSGCTKLAQVVPCSQFTPWNSTTGSKEQVRAN